MIAVPDQWLLGERLVDRLDGLLELHHPLRSELDRLRFGRQNEMLVGRMHGDRYGVRMGAGGQRDDWLRFQFQLMNWQGGLVHWQCGLVYGGRGSDRLMQVRCCLHYLWRRDHWPGSKLSKLLHLRYSANLMMVLAKKLSFFLFFLFQMLQ